MSGGMRFQSLGVLMVATVATAGFYGVSHTVATERQALADTRADVRASRAAIRRLKTELGTRASLRQLERWNAEVLGLDVPGPGQFVTSAGALASLDRSGLTAGRTAMPPMLVEAARMPEQLASNDVPTALPRPAATSVASDVSISRAVTEKRAQRAAMLKEEAKPATVRLERPTANARALASSDTPPAAAPRPASAKSTAAKAVESGAVARADSPATPAERSERLAQMEQRLALAIGGDR